MTNTMRLNDLQLVLLAGAAARDHGSLIPLPECRRQDTPHVTKAITSLLRRGLIEELAVTDGSLAWRREDHNMIGLFITQIGPSAIGADAQERAGEQPASPARPTSKIAAVLTLLRRDGGATLEELVAATGWLPHTTRAALTGLRKKGHVIAKGKRDDVTCYHVAPAA